MSELSLFDEEQCQVCEGWELELSDHDLCQNCETAYMIGYGAGFADCTEQHD
jgi:hypothetical protein